MIKWLVLFVFVTIALAPSAYAYTYTCEEGRFTIEVPEGVEVSAPGEDSIFYGYLSGPAKDVSPEDGSIFYVHVSEMDAKFVHISESEWMIDLGWSTDPEEFHEYFSLEDCYDHCSSCLFNPLTIDKHIDAGEAARLNVDTGFVLRSEHESCCWGVFVKGKRVYELIGYWEESGIQDVIRIFNSFRALD